jgi:hypothetical protein
MLSAQPNNKRRQPLIETRNMCPRCGCATSYYLGVTMVHSKKQAIFYETNVSRNYQCADRVCRHRWQD